MKTTIKTALPLCMFMFAASGAVAQDKYFEDPWAKDAEQYAKDYNVDFEEAKKRLKAQIEIGDLNNILTLANSDNFGGLYITHQPYAINILYKNMTQATKLHKRFKKASWHSRIKYHKAKSSLKELTAAQTHLHSLVKKLGFKADSDINVAKNQVELYVKNQYEFERALTFGQLDSLVKHEKHVSSTSPGQSLFLMKSKNSNTSVNIALIEVSKFAEIETDIYGGLALKTCTSGFSVENANGTKGIVTAGHCNNSQKFDGKDLTYQSGSYTGAYDVQWHTTDDFDVTNQIRICDDDTSTCKRKITKTVKRHTQAIGVYICKYGKTTGYTCGNIKSRNYLSTTQPNSTATFIRVSKSGVDLSSGGDSGGPWFSGAHGYGIHKCGIGNDACYMALDYLSILGVTVITD